MGRKLLFCVHKSNKEKWDFKKCVRATLGCATNFDGNFASPFMVKDKRERKKGHLKYR